MGHISHIYIDFIIIVVEIVVRRYTDKRQDYSLPRLSFVSHHLFSWPQGFRGWCYCRAFLECIQNEPSK